MEDLDEEPENSSHSTWKCTRNPYQFSSEDEHQRKVFKALKEEHPLLDMNRRAHITKVIPMSEAKKRPGYKEAMQKEVSRFFEYSAYGKPIPWMSMPKNARIYRGKPIYGVKFWEMNL